MGQRSSTENDLSSGHNLSQKHIFKWSHSLCCCSTVIRNACMTDGSHEAWTFAKRFDIFAQDDRGCLLLLLICGFRNSLPVEHAVVKFIIFCPPSITWSPPCLMICVLEPELSSPWGSNELPHYWLIRLMMLAQHCIMSLWKDWMSLVSIDVSPPRSEPQYNWIYAVLWSLNASGPRK